MTSTRATFGETLKTLRERRRISQAALARDMDADHSYISRLEAGQRTPSRDFVFRLEEHLPELTDAESRELRRGAGFLRAAEADVLNEPLLIDLSYMLTDEAIPGYVRDTYRSLLASMVEAARSHAR